MLDFFDDESIRVGNILGRNAPDRHKRNANGEETLHGSKLGHGTQQHDKREVLTTVTPQRLKKMADVDEEFLRLGHEGISGARRFETAA